MGIWSPRKHLISRKRLYEKVLRIFTRTSKKYNWFWKEELKSHQDVRICYICEKKILQKLCRSINYQNVRDHCHYRGKYTNAAHSICHLKFNVPNEIPVVFHNSSNYDDHFIIKELANAFQRKFECLGENRENYKHFSFQ